MNGSFGSVEIVHLPLPLPLTPSLKNEEDDTNHENGDRVASASVSAYTNITLIFFIRNYKRNNYPY